MHFLWFGKGKHANGSDDATESTSPRKDPAFNDYVALAYGVAAKPHGHKQVADKDIKLLPGIPVLDLGTGNLPHAEIKGEQKKMSPLQEAERGASLEEFYDSRELQNKFAEKDEARSLNEPWARKYKPVIDSFKSLSAMYYEVNCGVGFFGGRFAYFDPEVKYKHKEKDFDAKFLAGQMDGVKLAANQFEKAYNLETTKAHAYPAGLTPEQLQLYFAAMNQAKQLHEIIGPISTLLNNPVKADLNDPSFMQLVHSMREFYHLTDNSHFYHPYSDNPLKAADNQYFDTSIQFKRELNLRKEKLWINPEIEKIQYQISTLERYRQLGDLLDSVQNRSMSLCGDEIKDKGERQAAKDELRKSITQIKDMAAGDRLQKDLSDSVLAEQRDLIARCQSRTTGMMPAMLHLETILNTGGRERRFSGASSKLIEADYRSINDNPFWKIFGEEMKLNLKKKNAIDEQVRRASPPED